MKNGLPTPLFSFLKKFTTRTRTPEHLCISLHAFQPILRSGLFDLAWFGVHALLLRDILNSFVIAGLVTVSSGMRASFGHLLH